MAGERLLEDPFLSDRVTDDAVWRRVLREAALPRERQRWLRHFHEVHYDVYMAHNKEDRRTREIRFRSWCVRVLQIEVELYPGGRAVLRPPRLNELEIELDRELGYSDLRHVVEIRWKDDAVTSYQISHKHGLGWREIPMNEYVAAFWIRLREEGAPPDPDASPPHPGRPPSTGFYRGLLDEYDELVRQGHRSPMKELAARRERKEGTVKAWLHRGRRYLDEGRTR